MQITVSGVDQGFALVSSTWSLRVIVYSATPTNLSAQLLDPVPDYLDGTAVSTNTALLAVDSHVVRGVAADGVTQLLLGINADKVGDQISVTLLNDQQAQSTSSQEDGALGSLGATNFTASQVTVGAVQANNGAEAFAVYLAPIDFARLVNGQAGSYKNGSCTGVTTTDDQLACRSVMLRVQDLTDGALTFAQIIILRPPLIMIHGLWDNWQVWNNFSPLVSGPGIVDPRFSVGRVNYDNPVAIVASDPTYSTAQLQNASANSLGFAYNASIIAGQIDGWMTKFKAGENPQDIPVAAVQVDIVAHSMGGDIARTLVLQPNYVSGATYGQGTIHKVITIDTPHLGSPLASDLISSQEVGGCAETHLAARGKYVFNSVLLANGGLQDGAIADLSISSPALLNIANKSPRPLLAAFIAGINPSFEIPGEITFCSLTGDSLAAADLTPSTWSAIFGGQPNDAIVAEISQVNGLSGLQASSSTFVFSGVVHSPGSEHFSWLGFYPPSVLDPDSATGIPSTVIRLLNTPIASSTFSLLNP